MRGANQASATKLDADKKRRNASANAKERRNGKRNKHNRAEHVKTQPATQNKPHHHPPRRTCGARAVFAHRTSDAPTCPTPVPRLPHANPTPVPRLSHANPRLSHACPNCPRPVPGLSQACPTPVPRLSRLSHAFRNPKHVFREIKNWPTGSLQPEKKTGHAVPKEKMTFVRQPIIV